MSRATPGPWLVQGHVYGQHAADALAIVSQSGFVVRPTRSIDGMDADAVTANARLIAAAPDLLAACELLLAGETTLAFDAARAAIAKARGDA